MAKVRITLEDTPEGSISVKMKFDPELRADDEGTPAQLLAVRMMQALPGLGDEEDG